MRTKTLLGLAALAVGLTTASAQVYSLNVVGYVNVNLQANKAHFLSIPVTPVDGNYCITNTIVLSQAQTYANIYTWDGTQWASPATWYDPADGGSGWDTPLVISNGVGFFLMSVADSQLTFVGQVPQGDLAYQIPVGMSTLGNKIPVSTNFPGVTVGNTYDNIYTWDQTGQQWGSPATYYAPADGGSGWDTASVDGPFINPGEGVIYMNGGSVINFTRNFTVQ